jgi:hypothetical protein
VGRGFFALKASVLKRIEELEARLKPIEEEMPPVDFDLLIESEAAYFSRQMTVLRLKARELGYGDKNNTVSWFDLRGCDPVSNDEVREECLAALNADESRVIEAFHKVIEKLIRITAVLSDEEKADVKRYNDVAKRVQGLTSKAFAVEGGVEEELKQARRRYEEIIAKYGEEIYE